MYEKNSRIYLDRLQNKCTNCKGIQNNTNLGQNTGIQEHVNRMPRNEILFSNWQKESRKAFEETSGFVRLELVNKCPNSMTRR